MATNPTMLHLRLVPWAGVALIGRQVESMGDSERNKEKQEEEVDKEQ
jgi:hypothetical protein